MIHGHGYEFSGCLLLADFVNKKLPIQMNEYLAKSLYSPFTVSFITAYCLYFKDQDI